MPWAPKKPSRLRFRAQADYILCLKANHPTLFQQIDTWFETARAEGTPIPSEHTAEAGHHRTEIRSVDVLTRPIAPCIRQKWLGLQTIVIVERTRHLWNKTTHEIQFYLSSLPSESPRIAAAIRQHWGIENSCTGRSMSPLVKMIAGALSAPLICASASLCRQYPESRIHLQAQLKQKSKRAAMDDAYMLTLLAAALPHPPGDAT